MDKLMYSEQVPAKEITIPIRKMIYWSGVGYYGVRKFFTRDNLQGIFIYQKVALPDAKESYASMCASSNNLEDCTRFIERPKQDHFSFII